MTQTQRKWTAVAAILGAGIIVLHLTLPYWIAAFLNKRMADMGAYSGHVDRVSLSLYRGAYQLHDLNVIRIDGNKKVPFFRTDEIDISLSWSALFKGSVVADLAFHQPQVNFVDSRKDSKNQSGSGTDWRQTVKQLSPITINRIDVVSGRVAFRNFESSPPVNVQVNDIEATVTNLTNVDNGKGRVATLDVRAKALNDARLTLDAEFDPLANNDFVMALRCEEVSLPMLNELAKVYAAFDFKAGTAEVVSEIEAKDGALTGYVKPLLKNVDIFDWEQDVEQQEENVFQLAWEGLGGGLVGILTNSDTDRVATQLNFSGRLDNPEASTWEAVTSALRNAFVEAYNNNFEGLYEASTDDSPAPEEH